MEGSDDVHERRWKGVRVCMHERRGRGVRVCMRGGGGE